MFNYNFFKMKNLINTKNTFNYLFITSLLFVFSIQTSMAQIKVWPNKHVTVGGSSSAPLEQYAVLGDCYFHPSSTGFGYSNSGFYFQNYHNNVTSTGGTGSTWFDEPILFPQFNKTAWIGNANNEMYRVFATRFYSPNGQVYTSDRRLKTNIKLWDGSALSKIMNLSIYRYDMDATKYKNVPEEKQAQIAEDSKNKIGFIAQEIQSEFPEMVSTIPGTEYSGVEYTMMIPILLQAIKEQQALIEEMQLEINNLKNK